MRGGAAAPADLARFCCLNWCCRSRMTLGKDTTLEQPAHPELGLDFNGLQGRALHAQLAEVDVGGQAAEGLGLVGVVAALRKPPDAVLLQKGLQGLQASSASLSRCARDQQVHRQGTGSASVVTDSGCSHTIIGLYGWTTCMLDVICTGLGTGPTSAVPGHSSCKCPALSLSPHSEKQLMQAGPGRFHDVAS